MSSALTPGAIRDVAAAPLRSIRDDVGFFAARFGASSASLIAALDAFDVEKSKNDRDVDPRALARLGALACASAMRTTPRNARRCAWALDALGGLLRIGALGGRCDGALDDDSLDAFVGSRTALKAAETDDLEVATTNVTFDRWGLAVANGSPLQEELARAVVDRIMSPDWPEMVRRQTE